SNAYGAELMVRKKSGRMSGWIGYSLSWTRRKFPDTYINFGNWYYPRWDRRHDFVVVSTYEINDRWEISGQWKYNTGQGYTRALGTYTYHIPEYPSNFFNSENRRMLFGAENNYRFPADHRLDLSANYKHQFFGLPAILNISIYNVYSRRAIYYRDYNTDENPVEVTDVKLLPILPMVAYEVKF
ncbi:MAG: TonB-dependent receptor, partial [bacterium]|nr:TonB-dependent receptor [bacterium]